MKFKKLKQFKKQMQNVLLETEEKEQIKKDLVAFMQANPVRKNEANRRISEMEIKRLFLFFTQKNMYASIAAILIILTGTGTAFAAENTLPGDTLYPIKVHVNEPVLGAMALSLQAKANWESKVAERRLDEAAALVAIGRLSTDVETKLETRVQEQTKKIKNRIEKLEAEGNTEVAAEISARLETTLKLHEQLLEKLEASNEVTKADIKPLVKHIQDEALAINTLRVKLDAQVDTKAETGMKMAAKNRMENSQKHIAEVKKDFATKNIAATSSAFLKLETALKTQAEGKVQFEAEKYREAFVLFGAAQRLAHEAKLMAHVKTQLNFDTRIENILKDWDEKKDDRNPDPIIEKERKINLENTLRVRLDDREGVPKEEQIEPKPPTELEQKTNIELNTFLRVL